MQLFSKVRDTSKCGLGENITYCNLEKYRKLHLSMNAVMCSHLEKCCIIKQFLNAHLYQAESFVNEFKTVNTHRVNVPIFFMKWFIDKFA